MRGWTWLGGKRTKTRRVYEQKLFSAFVKFDEKVLYTNHQKVGSKLFDSFVELLWKLFLVFILKQS